MLFAQDGKKFAIFFTDKNGSPYSIANPSAFLSPRALARRANQGIPISENDIPVNQAYVDSIASTGVTIYNRSRWLNFITIDTTGHPNAASKIVNFSFVKSTRAVGKLMPPTPEDVIPKKETTANPQFNSTPNYGNSITQAHLIGADCMHQQGFMGEGMVIAVLDDGFYKVDSLPVFDSLWINHQILGTRDFSAPGSNVFNEDTHGMEVLSTIGGNLPGQLIGTAPKAQFWLLRSEVAATENIIEEYNWVAGAEFADSVGADIITSSLGYTTFDNPAQNQTYSEMNGRVAVSSIAATIAAEKGLVVVVAAGNGGQSSWPHIGSPADADSIITVGATDGSGVRASFSSYGPTSDHRIKPTVMAQGENSVLASSSGGTFTGNGTSFATPETAGAVACLWQANPKRTNMEIINAIVKSSSKFTNPDTAMGYGIPNFCSANLILGIENPVGQFGDNAFKVVPNPFKNNLTVNFLSDQTIESTIHVYDVSGRLVLTGNTNLTSGVYNPLPLNDLLNRDSGLYFVEVRAGNHSFFTRVIKY